MLKISVCVFQNLTSFERGDYPVIEYDMDHDEQEQRVVLGRQCRYAFEYGQVVVTFPVPEER